MMKMGKGWNTITTIITELTHKLQIRIDIVQVVFWGHEVRTTKFDEVFFGIEPYAFMYVHDMLHNIISMSFRNLLERHYSDSLMKLIIWQLTMGCSVRKMSATANNACLGHGNTQSIYVLPINPGKLLQRFLKASPAGDILKTTWRLVKHIPRKYAQTESLEAL